MNRHGLAKFARKCRFCIPNQRNCSRRYAFVFLHELVRRRSAESGTAPSYAAGCRAYLNNQSYVAPRAKLNAAYQRMEVPDMPTRGSSAETLPLMKTKKKLNKS